MATNKQQGNPRLGQAYRVQPAPGGSYHVYADGRKVFVPHTGAPQQTPSAAAAQPQQQQAFAPDSQYFSTAAQGTFDVGQGLAANDQQGVSNEATYREALRRLQEQRPGVERNAANSYNNQGLFYSGQYGKKLGDIATQFAERQADTRANYDSSEQARLAARRALEAGYTVSDAAAYAQSADRQVNNDTAQADAGTLAPPAPAAPVVPAGTVPQLPKPKKPYRTVMARGKVFHAYSSGRRVAVRPVSRP